MNKKRNDLTNDNIIQPDENPDFPNHDSDQPQAVPDLLDSVILGTEPQAASDLLDSVDLGTDVYGENHLQLPPGQTRSGRAYCSILKVTEHGFPKLDIARPGRSCPPRHSFRNCY
jgi:hypothetical protein